MRPTMTKPTILWMILSSPATAQPASRPFPTTFSPASPTSVLSLPLRRPSLPPPALLPGLLPRGGSSPPAEEAPLSALDPPSPPDPIVPAPPSPPPARSKSDVGERVVSAVVLLAAVTALVRHGGVRGVAALAVIAQTTMYREATSVCLAESRLSASAGSVLRRWVWFAAAQVLFVLPAFPECGAREDLPLLGHAAASACLVWFVMDMAADAELDREMIGVRLGEAAACVVSSLVVSLQSSYVIRTAYEFGVPWILFPALLVIVNDSMAYVFGRFLGKHKLIPRLSPKKTVEGFAGAAVYTAALALPVMKLAFGNPGMPTGDMVRHALVVAGFVSVVSPFGGFLASAVKRAHGAKDFGSFIPGHGGAIDRLDCQLVTAPFVYLYLKRFLKVAAEAGEVVDAVLP